MQVSTTDIKASPANPLWDTSHSTAAKPLARTQPHHRRPSRREGPTAPALLLPQATRPFNALPRPQQLQKPRHRVWGSEPGHQPHWPHPPAPTLSSAVWKEQSSYTVFHTDRKSLKTHHVAHMNLRSARLLCAQWCLNPTLNISNKWNHTIRDLIVTSFFHLPSCFQGSSM